MMEPVSAAVGLGVGVVSIASIFQTCLHGYRSLNTAMAIGNTALTLNVQFRVEELRLYLWGRNWGLVTDPKQTDEKEKSDSDSEEDEEADEEDDEKDSAKIDRVSMPVIFLDSVDEDLEIPGLRDLTIEVLGRIHKALEEWKLIGERYGAASPAAGRGAGASKESSGKLLRDVALRQEGQSTEISARTKFSSKLRWAMTDKAILEELLVKLTNFNDSLEKLLPKRERTSLARGLAGELLNLLESAKANNPSSNIGEQLSHLEGLDEVKAARIVGLKHINQTEKGERSLKEAENKDHSDGPTPFAKPSVWVDGAKGNMHIPFDHFIKLAQPKIQYHQTQENDGRWVTGKYAPLPRSLAVFAPPASASTPELPSDNPAQVTLIEWRPTAHESRASELTDEELKERRDHIARLLHRTSETDADFRVLDCLGYTTAPGHTPNGSTHDLIGYVYRYPEFASAKSLPVSLRELLGEAYHSDNPNVPPLDERFKLARNLAIALYQLQCAGWVHRKISSYNVIFFRDRATDKLDLSQPFLVGWQYSRPDDQRRIFPSERSSKGIADLDMYIHRRRLNARIQDRFPRYRKSFDMYSLGIILMEIAFWEPIISLTTEDERKRMEKFEDVDSGYRAKEWWKVISKTATDELAPEMGVAYRDAVLFCLEGSGIADEKRFKKERDRHLYEDNSWDRHDAYFDDSNFEEVGIEKEFYWRVLKALERFGM